MLFHWLPLAVKDWKRSEERAQDLEALAAIDPLTGIYNRRQFETLARAEFARAQRYMRPLSFLIVDIDFFKRVNDTFGHEMGDWVLKMVAKTIQSAKRDPDIVARIGGEEFALMLPETGAEAAWNVAERLRELVRSNSLKIGSEQLVLTVSLGVAEASARSSGIEAVLREADGALYEAKNTGCNQVRLAKRSVAVVSSAAE